MVSGLRRGETNIIYPAPLVWRLIKYIFQHRR